MRQATIPAICSGNRHYSAHCHTRQSHTNVPSEFTGTIAGNPRLQRDDNGSSIILRSQHVGSTILETSSERRWMDAPGCLLRVNDAEVIYCRHFYLWSPEGRAVGLHRCRLPSTRLFGLVSYVGSLVRLTLFLSVKGAVEGKSGPLGRRRGVGCIAWLA